MATLKVLLNARGDVIGTARYDAAPSGTGAPLSATPVAAAGQRLIEVNVDDNVLSLDPDKLHAIVKTKYVKPGKSAKGAGSKRSK